MRGSVQYTQYAYDADVRSVDSMDPPQFCFGRIYSIVIGYPSASHTLALSIAHQLAASGVHAYHTAACKVQQAPIAVERSRTHFARNVYMVGRL